MKKVNRLLKISTYNNKTNHLKRRSFLSIVVRDNATRFADNKIKTGGDDQNCKSYMTKNSIT